MKPTVKHLEVTLEDLYNGKETQIEVERFRKCPTCDGVGGTDPNAV